MNTSTWGVSEYTINSDQVVQNFKCDPLTDSKNTHENKNKLLNLGRDFTFIHEIKSRKVLSVIRKYIIQSSLRRQNYDYAKTSRVNERR